MAVTTLLSRGLMPRLVELDVGWTCQYYYMVYLDATCWNRGANGCNESSTSFESITTGTFLNSRRPERGSSLTRLNVGGDIPCDFLRHENCASVIAGASTEYIHLGRASRSHLVS